jgi:MFS family permease
MIAGIFSALSAGWFATWLKDRGYTDGTLRGCMIGCAGCVIGAMLGPLMPTPQLALTVYILTGIFANYPSVLGLAAIAEITPNEMRGTITAIYIMLIGLLSSGIGPFAVGVFTDYVFGAKEMIGMSMVAVTILTGVTGVAVLWAGLKPYRESLSRATWQAKAA